MAVSQGREITFKKRKKRKKNPFPTKDKMVISCLTIVLLVASLDNWGEL